MDYSLVGPILLIYPGFQYGDLILKPLWAHKSCEFGGHLFARRGFRREFHFDFPKFGGLIEEFDIPERVDDFGIEQGHSQELGGVGKLKLWFVIQYLLVGPCIVLVISDQPALIVEHRGII